jgi:hypothetical protein
MAADNFEIVPPGSQSASAASPWFTVDTATMLMVGVDITVGVSVTRFDAWLEGSDDGGTTAYEIPADLTLVSDASAAGQTPAANARNIINNHTGTGAKKAIGIYKHLPTDRVRLRWILNGTSVTFSSSAVVK